MLVRRYMGRWGCYAMQSSSQPGIRYGGCAGSMHMLALTLTLPPRLDLLTQTLHESTPSDATKSRKIYRKRNMPPIFTPEMLLKTMEIRTL